MFAQAQRRRRRDRMRMVGRANHYRINVLLFEHLSEIVVSLGAGKFLFGRCKKIVVDVAQGDDVFLLHAGDVRAGAIGRADDAEVKFVIRGESSRRRCLKSRQRNPGSGQGGGLQELAAGNVHMRQL